MAFIDQYRTRFGVEPICRVLRERNVGIAPSTYYAYKSRPPSARTQRDAWLIEQIRQAHQDNYGMCAARRRCGHSSTGKEHQWRGARCSV